MLVILSHDRQRILHFNVTANPTAEWTARQLLEACVHDEAPTYLIRDRDSIYGEAFHRQAIAFQIGEVPKAARSPWQNPYAERVIGSIRRECLDHVIVLGERHLERVLSSYADYYNRAGTHRRWGRTHCMEDRPSPRHSVGLLHSLASVNCITNTRGWRRDNRRG